MKGRKPVPTAIKVATGNPGRRPLNFDEPKPRAEAPPLPGCMTGRALEHWNFLTAQLEEMGILANTDGGLLTAYCIAVAQLEFCKEQLDKDGLIVVLRNDKGEVKSVRSSPYQSISSALMDKIKSMASELGLSATSRVRLKVSKPAAPARDDWDDIISLPA